MEFRSSIHAAMVCAVLFCITGISRADILFNDFSVGTDLSLMDDAALVANRLRLNPAAINQNGTAFHDDKQDMQAGFETRFRFEITGMAGSSDPEGNPGGDGFALIIQNQAATATGPFINYIPYSIPNAFVIEFDTWKNDNLNDPSGNHISLQPIGATPDVLGDVDHNNSIGSTSAIPNLSAGIHEALITYAPGSLQIYIDNLLTPVLTSPIDLTNVNGINRLDANGKAWIGFAGGTGGSVENHDILDWSFTSIPEPTTAMLMVSAVALLAARRRRQPRCSHRRVRTKKTAGQSRR